MTYQEKWTWLYLVMAPVGYAVYLILTFTTGDGPLDGDAYVWPMIWTILGAIGAGILAGIVLGIVVGMSDPRQAGKSDQRDREISWFGDRVGGSLLVAGALGALVLAFVEAPHAWIANVLYLGFVLSAILGSIVKLVAYRRGM